MSNSKNNMPMAEPNVEEIRAIRTRLFARCGNDLGKLCEHLRKVEAQYAERVVKAENIGSRKN